MKKTGHAVAKADVDSFNVRVAERAKLRAASASGAEKSTKGQRRRKKGRRRGDSDDE